MCLSLCWSLGAKCCSFVMWLWSCVFLSLALFCFCLRLLLLLFDFGALWGGSGLAERLEEGWSGFGSVLSYLMECLGDGLGKDCRGLSPCVKMSCFCLLIFLLMRC